MNLPRLGIYEKALPEDLGWQQRLTMAAEAGFQFVEMSVDESAHRLARLDWSAAERRMLRDAVATTGIQVPTMCLSAHRKYALGSASDEIRGQALEILHKAIHLAVDVGIRVIQLAGYYVYYETHDEGCAQRYQDSLAAGLEWASNAGVMLALENVDGNDIDSISNAMRLVDVFRSPWFQVYPDIGNLAEHGLDICTELERGRGHMVGIHLKDTRPGEPRRVPFGAGVVPFVDAFQKLAEMRFPGPFVLEMWNDDSPQSRQIVSDAREWILSRMAEGNLLASSPMSA